MSVNQRRLSNGKTVYDVRLRTPEGANYKRSFQTRREALLLMPSTNCSRDADFRAAVLKGFWTSCERKRHPVSGNTAINTKMKYLGRTRIYWLDSSTVYKYI